MVLASCYTCKNEHRSIVFVSANVFLPYFQENNIQFPVIVFLDGHASHLSYPLSEFCALHQIILICLPPNATHFIQPLDVGFYGPFKKKWKKFIRLYRLKNGGVEIKKHLLPKFINEMGLDFFELDIKKAFKVCGIFPFNENNLRYEKLVSYHKNISNDKAVSEIDKKN